MLGRRNADKALPESKEKEKNEGEDGWHEEDLTWESLSVDKQEIILSEKDKIIKISLQALQILKHSIHCSYEISERSPIDRFCHAFF